MKSRSALQGSTDVEKGLDLEVVGEVADPSRVDTGPQPHGAGFTLNRGSDSWTAIPESPRWQLGRKRDRAAGIKVLQLIRVKLMAPETKGRSLEEIQQKLGLQ